MLHDEVSAKFASLNHELWIQEAFDRKRLDLVKIKSKYNPADILTKYLSREEIDTIVDRFGHSYEGGRSDVAPDLSYTGVRPMMRFTVQNYKIRNCAMCRAIRDCSKVCLSVACISVCRACCVCVCVFGLSVHCPSLNSCFPEVHFGRCSGSSAFHVGAADVRYS